MPHAYVKYLADVGYYVMTKRQLPGIALHVGYRDRGDVLATDSRRGLWYFTNNHEAKRYFYGPFSSKQAAGRAYDAYEIHSRLPRIDNQSGRR